MSDQHVRTPYATASIPATIEPPNLTIGKHDTLHDLLDRACTAFSGHNAIEGDDQALTYAQLNTAAGRLANCLLDNELPKGSIIAVLLNDRARIITALVGILRAGCIFVPLDPAAPEDRLRRIVADVTPDCFIVEGQLGQLADHLLSSSMKLIKIMNLDGADKLATISEEFIPIQNDLASYSDRAPEVVIEPDDPCYIYYTSGSTGAPKGIVGRVKSLAHFIKWELETFNVEPGWRVSQFTMPTFDAFLRDVFVPLCSGGTICIPPDKPSNLHPSALIDWIDRAQINLIHCVPTVFSGIVAYGVAAHRFAGLKYVLMSGEVLHTADVKRWYDTFGSRITLVNFYGPTETTMIKFFHRVEAADIERGFIPIGQPMRGARALVLDADGKVCPQGVAGELYIRTPFMTLGYHNNPVRTSEVFIKNPFSTDPKDIVYKTGDFVRMLADGNFQFIGRADNQVKIRGNRVELGEIESALRTNQQIKAAAVVVWSKNSGDQRLVAYIVPAPDQAPSTSDIRSFLSTCLPDYMIPSAFVLLEALPLLPNGKIDRNALPDPGTERPDLGIEFVAPRTPVEEQLAAIWQQALDIERVGIHDHFFELGGHSLLATQVMYQIIETFQVDLPIRTLFDTPTVADLAQSIAERQSQGSRDRIERAVENQADDLLAQLDHLPDEEVTALLGKLLHTEEA